MSKKRKQPYPRQKSPNYFQHTPKRHSDVICQECKGHFERGEEVVSVTTEVSYMRGDDIVEFFCLPCAHKRGVPIDDFRLIRYAWKLATKAGYVIADIFNGRLAAALESEHTAVNCPKLDPTRRAGNPVGAKPESN